MTGTGKYILNGKEPELCEDLMTWAQWFEGASRRVAETIIGEVRVSTVFLGLDHNFMGRGRPVLFETMVFGGPFDGDQARCSTWDEAEEQHRRMVAKVETEAV